MRVLIAPDCFTGTLTAGQAAAAIAEGWRRQAPHDEVELCPLSDGGPGFIDVLRSSLDARTSAVMVTGPLGEPAPAAIVLAEAEDGVLTGYLESAQACGLHLVPAGRRDPGRTSTAGVAALLEAARDAGAGRVVIGLGGSGTNDAGAGLLAALAVGAGVDVPAPVRERLAGGGAALAGVTSAELAWLCAVRDSWAGVDLLVATDVDVPLLGLRGASAGFAAQKGATPEQAQELERCLADFAVAALDVLGLERRASARPGAGAAGGLGFGLLLLGGRRVPGAQAVLEAVRFAERVRHNDLVITGEGRFDWQSLRGKVVAAVARQGLEIGRPVVVVAGQVEVGRREALAIGVESAYPVARTPGEVTMALADPYRSLADRAARVARTWSRSPG
ncbi:MAG TPA: glycerate kinase [Kineosporiaceae bacterium]